MFLTDRLFLRTKEIVRQAKRYYHGIFKNNTDSNAIFYPLTKRATDVVAVNLNFNVKDIQVTARVKDARAKTVLLRELLATYLKKGQFGRTLNEIVLNFCRDGTVVVRTYEENGVPKSKVIDLENLWTDFATDEPSWFLERVEIPKETIPSTWNQEYISQNTSSKFRNLGLNNRNTVIAYRWEGFCPKGWLTGYEDDKTPVLALLWITGLESGQKPYIHSRKILGKSMDDSSYDFAQFSPNSARFIAMGIPEAVAQLQQYSNLNINNRIKMGTLASAGMLVVRKGSGLTPDMVNNLREGMALPINDVNDVRQITTQDISQTSFSEEDYIRRMADSLTGATEISRGQLERSGATLGQVNLEANFSNVRFSYLKEAVGFMIERMVAKWLKIIIQNMSVEEVIRITDENIRAELARELARMDLVETLKKNFSKFGARGLLGAVQLFDENYFYTKRFKENEFKLLKDSAKNLEWEVQIDINSESVDKQSLANNLIQSLPLVQTLPNGQVIAQEMVEKLFEVLGMSTIQFNNKEAVVGQPSVDSLISAQR